MPQARAISANASTVPTGSLTVITGSMFSGKTEELIQRLRRALYARRRVQVFKHAKVLLDTRSELTEIRTHNDVLHQAIAASTSGDLLEGVEPSTDVVAIEEAQFFDAGIVAACRRLADSGREVIVAGLDMDFRGLPFSPMPILLAEADEVVKLRPLRPGRLALPAPGNGQPTPASAPTILIGAQESYEARCRHCHEV
jgi:thymidine kinase